MRCPKSKISVIIINGPRAFLKNGKETIIIIIIKLKQAKASPKFKTRYPRRYFCCGSGLFQNPPSLLLKYFKSMAAGKRNEIRMGSLQNDIGTDRFEMANGGFMNDNKVMRKSKERLMTLPTILTLGRVASVPILVSTFYLDGWWATTTTTCIFIAAAITDWLDGYLARKMRLGTVFGAFLDPVADKLMVAATLVLLCTKPLEVSLFGDVPWLITAPSIAIIGREITMSAVREWAASQNTKFLQAVAVNSLGKWKTASQMIALTILLATRDPSLAEQQFAVVSGVGLLYMSAGLALWSLAVYMKNIWKILLQ